jgi:thiamine pyrophosphate-dependent acetolactate synthase large subunit-like protein
MQINLSEFIINELLKNNIDTAFIVAGGGSMFLVDAIGKSRMKKYYLHHEQSCSMAAEGYAKVLNKPALVCVTTGPAGINAINGVFGAHVDSCPMIIISGSYGLSREDIDSLDVTKYVIEVAKACKNNNLELVVGGAFPLIQ